MVHDLGRVPDAGQWAERDKCYIIEYKEILDCEHWAGFGIGSHELNYAFT